MALYHLTAELTWEKIDAMGELLASGEKRRRGIRGMYAQQMSKWDEMLDNLIWLTTNPTGRQGWMAQGMVYEAPDGTKTVVPEPDEGPMYKGQVIIQVECPEAVRWQDYAREHNFPQWYYNALAEVSPESDPREWWVTPGPIPRERWLLAMRTSDQQLLWANASKQVLGDALGSAIEHSRLAAGDEYVPVALQYPTGEAHTVGAHLLLDFAGEFLGVDELTVTRSLDAMHRPNFNDLVETHSSFIGLLRTAAIYQLAWDEIKDALLSEPPEEFPELPPLPFSRVWIEATTTDDPRDPGRPFPCSLVSYSEGDDDPDTLNIIGIGLVERIPGAVWDVYVPYDVGDASSAEHTPDRFNVIGMRVTPRGFDPDDPATEGWNDTSNPDEMRRRAERQICGLAVTLAQLLTARNVPIRDVVLPRPQRKRFQQRHPYYPRSPRIYYVDLAAAGESKPGSGDRHYHVRYIRSGYWYHVPAGWNYQRMCTCGTHEPRPASWVPAHVRGPVGAPWKGRPIHRSVPKEDEAA